jgi:hypothetical protein
MYSTDRYGVVDDVWMAARVGGKAKILRTHPPGYAAGHGVDALTFSGSYPLTRLLVEDDTLTNPVEYMSTADNIVGGGVETRVYGYSTLKPTDMKESAYPALALTLEVKNTGTTGASVLSCPVLWSHSTYNNLCIAIRSLPRRLCVETYRR